MHERQPKQFSNMFLFFAINNYKTEKGFLKPFYEVTTNKTKQSKKVMKREYN